MPLPSWGGALDGEVAAGERCMRMGAELARGVTPPTGCGDDAKKSLGWREGVPEELGGGWSVPRRGSQPHSGAVSVPPSPLAVPWGCPTPGSLPGPRRERAWGAARDRWVLLTGRTDGRTDRAVGEREMVPVAVGAADG